MELRPYQQDCINSLLEYLCQESRALAVLPTGLGKTVIAKAIIERGQLLKPGLRTMIVINNVDLIAQTQRRYAEAGLMASVYCDSLGVKELSQTTIASIQSVFDVPLDGIDLLIVDETHNVSNDEETRYHSFLSKHKGKLIGFTATPFRSGDGYIFGKGKFYKDVAYSMNMIDAISQGWIVPPRLKHTEHQFDTRKLSIKMGEFNQTEVEKMTNDIEKTTEQIKDALGRMESRHKIVWACSCISHAELVYNLLSSFEPAAIVHSERVDRADQISSYLQEPLLRHLIFVNIVKEGFDFPPIDCIVFLRPTRSPGLMIQIVGRGLRPYKDKTDCLVLDYGQVVQNCGPLNNPIVREKGERRSSDIPAKFCPECLEYCHIAAIQCECCGYKFVTEERTYAKNLTVVAEQKSDILETVNREVDVASISFREHQSKSGNKCAAIDYHVLFQRFPISEYFVMGNDFAMNRFRKRLEQMGFEYEDEERMAILSSTEDKMVFLSNRFKYEIGKIVIQKDGNFYRVQEIRKTDRTRDFTSPKQMPDF
jgi:DNA repair protein RadD